MRGYGRLALLALPWLLLNGCAGTSLQVQLEEYAPSQEERLVVYTSHKEEVYRPIIREFEERTGIWVEIVTGGSNELLEQISRESSQPVADVMFGGGVESLEAYRECFAPYICADREALQPLLCSEDDLWTPFSALPIVLIYNTKLVDEHRISRWEDLLEPEFRGRIAISDPSVSGSGLTGLMTMLYALGGEREAALMSFAEHLEGRQMESSGDVLTSVAGGTDWVGITLEETALKHIAAGDSLAMVYPQDGTSCVPDASALVKGAPHEENAKLFLDFTVSLDVQRLLTRELYRRPVRSDVEPVQELVALEELTLVDYDVAWVCDNRDEVLMSWKFFLDGGGQP